MNKAVPPPTISDYLRAPAHLLRKMGGRRTARLEFDSKMPLVTVFTIVLNAKGLLSQTIKSVLAQSYPNIEYIIIDGASSDGTLEVIEEFNERVDLWISEPDQGTSDATNKAVSLARGKFVFWLSAGDWIESDYIATAVQALLNSGADFVFGRMTFREGIVDYIVEGDANYKMTGTYKPRVNYPTWVTKRECFKNVGLFDLSYKISCDYEWGLRLWAQGGRGFYVSKLIVNFFGGGISEIHASRGKLESLRALRQHGVPTAVATTAIVYDILRTEIRHLLKLLLPPYIYERVMRFVRRGYMVARD